MTGPWPLKRTLLSSLIGALVLSGLFGIYVFLFGDFGETEARILATTAGVAYYSLMSLACAVAWERRRTRVLSYPGLATSAVGFLFLLLGTWGEYFESEAFAKATVTLAIFAFSLAQACVLTLARLRPRLAWVSWTAVVSVFSLAVVVSTMIVLEVHEELWFRAVGVLAIVDGCASLSIPVLYKLGGLPAGDTARQPYPRIELVCPRCGHRAETWFPGSSMAAGVMRGVASPAGRDVFLWTSGVFPRRVASRLWGREPCVWALVPRRVASRLWGEFVSRLLERVDHLEQAAANRLEP